MKERHSINICYSIDINECKEGLHGCHVNAICNNTEGSYNCTCKPGFIGDGRNSCKGIEIITDITWRKVHNDVIELTKVK